MKWLIYGYKGWIGQQLITLLKENSNNDIINGLSRANNYNQTYKEIIKHNPDRIICCIGRTHGPGCSTIDYIEDKLDINLRDNLEGPLNLAIICNKINKHLTYFGTGCIFEYDDIHTIDNNIGYTEDDDMNFTGSSYSTVKGHTDKLMKQYNNVLNIRIRMPVSATDHPRNLITKLTNYSKVVNIANSITVLPDILPIIIDMSEKNVTGTYNMTNPGSISHNGILDLYRKYVDNDFSYANFSLDEQDMILKAKRSNNYLDTSKLEGIYDVKNVRDSLSDLLKKYVKI